MSSAEKIISIFKNYLAQMQLGKSCGIKLFFYPNADQHIQENNG